MNPGLMRTPIVLKQRTNTTSVYGQSVASYTGTTQLFGQITDASADEKLNHLKMNLVVTHKITCNFYPGIKSYDRFEAQISRDSNNATLTATFEIISALDYRSEGHTLNFICREIAT
jgi:head-tail adaptor